jgi:hypothetical protein
LWKEQFRVAKWYRCGRCEACLVLREVALATLVRILGFGSHSSHDGTAVRFGRGLYLGILSGFSISHGSMKRTGKRRGIRKVSKGKGSPGPGSPVRIQVRGQEMRLLSSE